MGSDAAARLLDCLASRLETLLGHLEDRDCSASLDVIGELAHELKGSAGTLRVHWILGGRRPVRASDRAWGR